MFNGDLIWGVSWIWYLIGVLGVGGTIAFFVLDAVAAAAFFKGIIKFLWSTRIGWALVAGSLCFFIADTTRSRRDEAAFAARTAAFEEKQKQRDEQIAQDTRTAVLQELAQTKIEDTETDKDVKEFHDVPPVPGLANPFRVGPDADRLRVIAGAPDRGSKGAQGVPKARKPSVTAGHHGGFRLPKLIRRSPGPTE